MMKVADPSVKEVVPEFNVYSKLLPFEGAQVLELGCGKAQHTREIAEKTHVSAIVAMEVDEIQHELNLKIRDLPKVRFEKGGAQQIAYPDNHFDIVMMFKSLHHVPLDRMSDAMHEIKRVMKPGGLLYISEPVFAGDFNDIIRLFNDEEIVRTAAFNATKKAVDEKLFYLVGEHFFNTPMKFKGFQEFEKNILGITHTQFHITDEIYKEVKTRFMKHVVNGDAHFAQPIRVDLLRKQ